MPERWMTTGEFVARLLEVPEGGEEAALKTAQGRGWLEAQDVLAGKSPLLRSAAARILHEFLKKELGERDDEDLAPAKALRDLYDCRTCVNHVAQVFCKELMTAVVLTPGMMQQRVYASERGNLEIAFGMREPLSRQEAFGILERVFHPSGKKKQITAAETGKKAEEVPKNGSGEERGVVTAKVPMCLLPRDAERFVKEHPGAAWVDVRTRAEYETAHGEGMINVPLMELLENPETVDQDKERFILLGCDGGYRSAIAAQCLAQAGYLHVFFYGWAER